MIEQVYGNGASGVTKTFVSTTSDPNMWQHATPGPIRDNMPKSLKQRAPIKGIRVGARMPLSLNIPDLPEGACIGAEDPDIFHPCSPNSEGKIAAAKAICNGCPMRRECLDWCLKFEAKQGEVQGGIWGGTTEWERGAEIAPAAKKFCRSGRHVMAGDNAVTNGRGVRCRACWNESIAASTQRRREGEKIGA